MAENRMQIESAGTRVGFSTHQSKQFYQTEAFACWDLPWGITPVDGWNVHWRLDISLGALNERGIHAAIGAVGPSLVLSRVKTPVTFEIGCSPTVLSRYEFESREFGTPVQFTSHAGVNYDFGEHWRVGYRLQHMSNARLNPENPGLNLHMLSVSWRF